MDVFKSRFIDGHYSEPENLGGSINSEFAESNPYIAPDESYLIFTSHGRSDGYGKYDLYISFRKTEGSWTKAKNMGNQSNSKEPLCGEPVAIRARGRAWLWPSERGSQGGSFPTR